MPVIGGPICKFCNLSDKWWAPVNGSYFKCIKCNERLSADEYQDLLKSKGLPMLSASFTWEHNLSMYKLKFDNIQGGNAWKTLKEVLDIVKGTIPAGSHRDYDPATKEWFIHPDYQDYLNALLESKLGKNNIFFFKKPDEIPANISKNLTVQDELKILAKLSGESVMNLERLDKANATKLYRRLALKYHPDRDPKNGPLMSELNMVWNSLKEGYYIK